MIADRPPGIRTQIGGNVSGNCKEISSLWLQNSGLLSRTQHTLYPADRQFESYPELLLISFRCYRRLTAIVADGQ